MSKASSKSHDPLRAQCHELTQDLIEHVRLLRDYATTPGNAWLAQGELSRISTTVSELDSLLEAIKEADKQL